MDIFFCKWWILQVHDASAELRVFLAECPVGRRVYILELDAIDLWLVWFLWVLSFFLLIHVRLFPFLVVVLFLNSLVINDTCECRETFEVLFRHILWAGYCLSFACEVIEELEALNPHVCLLFRFKFELVLPLVVNKRETETPVRQKQVLTSLIWDLFRSVACLWWCILRLGSRPRRSWAFDCNTRGILRYL